MSDYYKCKLIGIDAYRDDCGGWLWNDLFIIEDGIIISEDSDLLTSSRKLIKYFRDNLQVLNNNSKGNVIIDFNNDIMGGVLLVVCAKGTKEPLFAISSIH